MGESALLSIWHRNTSGLTIAFQSSLMNLLELSSGDDFGCSQLVVCLDRTADPDDVKDLTRDLGWVGFELATLDSWSNETACTSDRWLLLSMDV